MDLLQQLLQVSALLFKHLSELPPDKERDEYLQITDRLLDERGAIIEKLQQLEVNPLPGHPFEKQLRELDERIRKRLKAQKDEISTDIKNLHLSKKSERSYVDPYASVRVMDGSYFDGKK